MILITSDIESVDGLEYLNAFCSFLNGLLENSRDFQTKISSF